MTKQHELMKHQELMRRQSQELTKLFMCIWTPIKISNITLEQILRAVIQHIKN